MTNNTSEKQKYTARVSNGLEVKREYTMAYSVDQARRFFLERGRETGFNMIGEVFQHIPKDAPDPADHIGYLNIYKDENGNLKAGGMYKTKAGANSVAKSHRFCLGIVVWGE